MGKLGGSRTQGVPRFHKSNEPDSCSQFSFTIPLNVQGKVSLTEKNVSLQNRTGENCLPRHTKRKQHRWSKSLAQKLRAMPRAYCRIKSQLTHYFSHPCTSTKSPRIWSRDNYKQHFTTELVPITLGRGNSFVWPIQSVLLQRTNCVEGKVSLVDGVGKGHYLRLISTCNQWESSSDYMQ